MNCEETCQFGELRYQFHEDDQVTQNEAEELCREIPRGELASIPTIQDIHRLATCCRPDKRRRFWIGLKRDIRCSYSQFQHPYRSIGGNCLEELPFEIKSRYDDDDDVEKCFGVTIELPTKDGKIRGREEECRKNKNYFCQIRNEPVTTTTKSQTTIGLATEQSSGKNASILYKTTPSNLVLKATAGGISAAVFIIVLVIAFIMYKKSKRSERKQPTHRETECSKVEGTPSTVLNYKGTLVPPKWNNLSKNQNRTTSRGSESYYIEPETVPGHVFDKAIEHEYVEIDKTTLPSRPRPPASAPPLTQPWSANPEENYLTMDQQYANKPETNDEYLQPLSLKNT